MIFTKNKKRNFSKITVFLFILFSGMIYLFSISAQDSNDGQTEKYIEDAIQKAAFHCYAAEGSFPPDMEYLTKNYGILFDTDKYIADYQSRGGNILPDIFVSRKGKN